MILWVSPSPQSKRHHNRFSCFRTADRKVSLNFTVGCPFPLKITPSHGGSEPQSWFAGLTRVLNPSGISIGSAVFAGLKCDRPTETTLSVTVDHVYVRSTGDTV